MTVSLTVASFNIRNGKADDRLNHWYLRRRTTAAWLRRLNADVVGLQEVYPEQRSYLSRQMPPYAVVGTGRNADGTGEQVPVFVRRPVAILDVRYHWFSDTPDVPGTLMGRATLPRMATLATCEHLESGFRFEVANLHLDHRFEENRANSAQQVIAALDPDLPAIVMGDLNAAPTTSRLYDIFDEAGFERLDYQGSSFNAFKRTTADELGPIDQILVRDGGGVGWTNGDARLLWSPMGRVPSDHWPLVATVDLGPTS